MGAFKEGINDGVLERLDYKVYKVEFEAGDLRGKSIIWLRESTGELNGVFDAN